MELSVEIKWCVRTHYRGLSPRGTTTPKKASHRPDRVKGVDAAEVGHPPAADFAVHLVQGGIHVEQQLTISKVRAPLLYGLDEREGGSPRGNIA